MLIVSLQQQALTLKTKRDNLLILHRSAEPYKGLPEHSLISQMLGITDMQIDSVKKALTF